MDISKLKKQAHERLVKTITEAIEFDLQENL